MSLLTEATHAGPALHPWTWSTETSGSSAFSSPQKSAKLFLRQSLHCLPPWTCSCPECPSPPLFVQIFPLILTTQSYPLSRIFLPSVPLSRINFYTLSPLFPIRASKSCPGQFLPSGETSRPLPSLSLTWKELIVPSLFILTERGC